MNLSALVVCIKRRPPKARKSEKLFGCTAKNEEPYRSCMARKVKFVDEETYYKRDSANSQQTEVRQENLFGF